MVLCVRCSNPGLSSDSFFFSINALYQKIRDIHTISIDCLVFDLLIFFCLDFLCRYHCSLLVGDA